MRFGVLGSVEAWRDDVRTEIGTPRNRAVLARLLLSRGKVIPLDRLIDDLWEGAAPPQALSSLRTFICQLRRVLEPGLLVTEPGGYMLRVGDDDLDSARFERLFRQAGEAEPKVALELLDEALGLWRGPAYVEFAATLWAEGEAARLEELRLSATERRLDVLLSLGRHAEAVPELEVHARAHPTREDAWRLLALGLYRSARQGDALAALREARRYLADELGVDPGPGLRRLEADILSQTAGLDLPAAPIAAPAARSTWVQPAPIRCLGRDELLAATGAALAAAESGAGGHLVFEGEPGAGKTELLRAAEALAHVRGFRVAEAGTHPLEREHAYGVARQIFEPLLCAMPEEERAEILSGAVAPAAGAVWHNGLSTTGPAVLHALYWLAVRLAERSPLLIAVDDLQWSDPESLRWLAYLVRRSGRVPIAVVATRATGAPVADPGLLEELCALLGRTELGSSPPEAVAVVAAELLGAAPSPATLAAYMTYTGGNAFLLTEFMAAGAAAGSCPQSVTRWLGDWLRKAGRPALEVARAVAMLGELAEPVDVAAMAGLDLGELLDVLPVLVDMRVLQDAAPLRFASPMMRQAVLDGMPSSVQRIREQALRLVEPMPL